MSSTAGDVVSHTIRRPAARALRFWARRLVLLQVLLFALVWLLYGSLALHGNGSDYYARATDFWLERDPQRFERAPGIENVLLPAAGAFIAKMAARSGLEFDETWFVVLTVAPYPLFVAGLTWVIARGSSRSSATASGRVLACAAALAMYTSGMIPYMASWGGYVDGVSYLLLLPALLWPGSISVYAATFVLQCLNHYLGAVALLLLAFVSHTVGAVTRHRAPSGNDADARRRATDPRSPVPDPRSLAIKAIISAIVLGAFVSFWNAVYPEAAHLRQQIVLEKWSDPAGILGEVFGPFPWTLLSPLKLTIVPVAALMLAPLPGRRIRNLALATPFVAALVVTLVFVDVTRVATMLVLPALLVTIQVARNPATDAATRRTLRRLLLATAALNLLIPNYYVNNGGLHVPPPVLLQTAIDWIAGT